MKTYCIGIIGYGGFGKFLHHWFNKINFFKVFAIAETGNVLMDYQGLRVYYDWKDLINDTEIDTVSIGKFSLANA
ncbi:hypothetical protein [Pedobacter agri]|uniref:hypothetical protein n=1 Tax=Pedobacter agri TaxID=454586 RepID=UPI002930FEFD|nr:hypothetical protein [Pedobacter agri]